MKTAAFALSLFALVSCSNEHAETERLRQSYGTVIEKAGLFGAIRECEREGEKRRKSGKYIPNPSGFGPAGGCIHSVINNQKGTASFLEICHSGRGEIDSESGNCHWMGL